VQVPNGLAFVDFRGHENWEDVAVGETEIGIKVKVANATRYWRRAEAACPSDFLTTTEGQSVAWL
jgi:hypothetical protein